MDILVVVLVTFSHLAAFGLGYALRSYISTLHRSYR
jgi:hypothetical protein